MVPGAKFSTTDSSALLSYVRALEVEVDRLRRHNRLVNEATISSLTQLKEELNGTPSDDGVTAIKGAAWVIDRALDSIHKLNKLPMSHTAEDQVIAVALRPLAEQIFRWHKRLSGDAGVTLRFEMDTEHVDWFPARLRYILDNLISNSLRYADPSKTEHWVCLHAHVKSEGYELQVSDNGVGLSQEEQERAFDLKHRADPNRQPELGVGLAVVKLLVEQSGGSLTVESGQGQGSKFRVFLPRYELEDFIL